MKKKIRSKKVTTDTRQMSTNVTPEMLSDVKNIDFYVKKTLVKPINNKIITIKEYSNNYYKVDINYVFFDRLIKLNKIINKDTYKEIISIIEICNDNRSSWWEVMQNEQVEEIAKEINKDIIKKLILMGNETKHNI